jgi:hypothetical protein
MWAQLLPLYEWWSNTSYHIVTCITSCEAFYGQKPPSVVSYMLGVSKVQEVYTNITVCEAILCAIKSNLVMSHNCMKQQEYQGHSEHHFVEGDHVFLRLQPYKHTSFKDQHFQKLVPKFYGPYIVLNHVGLVAYQLTLSNYLNIYLVFHVFFLKKVIGTKCQTQTSLPKLDEEGSIWLQPQVVLA